MVKQIDGYPAYRIYDSGIIESCWIWGPYYPGMKSKHKWRELPRRYKEDGYIPVQLSDGNGKIIRTHLHRLLAISFISPPPTKKSVVRHLDGNPRNNAISNLAWGSYKDNEDDKIAHGTWNTRNGGAKLTPDQVIEIRLKCKNGEKQEDLSKEYGVSRPTITRIANKTIWRDL